MIDYAKINCGDILKIIGAGAPGYAELGDLVRVVSVTPNSVMVEDCAGIQAEFLNREAFGGYDQGAERLETTEHLRHEFNCNKH